MLASIQWLETRVALCQVHSAAFVDAAVAPLEEAVASPADGTQMAEAAQTAASQPASGAKHGRHRGAPDRGAMIAENLTTPTLCAEEDNVNVPLSVPRARTRMSFTVEARHPTYPIGPIDYRDADFTNCPPATFSATQPQKTQKVYDDHVATAIEAVHDPNFHRPGMQVKLGRATVRDIHFIRLIRKIAEVDSWPEVLVLYSDGNLRLKPQASPGGVDPVFGSSVIIGPAPRAQRPVAMIKSVGWVPSKQSLRILYQGGGAALVKIVEANRRVTRLSVQARYFTSREVPFATVRSMFVGDGNADMDSVRWAGPAGPGAQAVTTFATAGGTEFLFGRARWSRHNTRAPDIWIGNLK
jgi:hypothetical protein